MPYIQKYLSDGGHGDGNFRALLEAAPDAMVIVNQRGIITLVNAQAEKVFQYQRRELLGRPIEVLIPKRFRKNHVEHRKHYTRNPHVRPMGAGLDLYGQRKNGNEFPVEISLSPLNTPKGVLMIAAIRDITDRKTTEAAMATTRHIIQAEETERRRIARELHDSLNQLLSSAKFRIQVLDSQLKPSENQYRESAQEAANALKAAILEVRRISQNLRPVILDDLGLIPALRSLCQEFEKISAIKCSFKENNIPKKLSHELEFSIYRIVQEALSNIRKHSGAKRASVTMIGKKEGIQVSIQDNGKGFSPQATQKIHGSGLANMSDRTKFSGGILSMKSGKGGTTIVLEIPLNNASH